MSGGQRSRRRRSKKVLVFGESENDTKAIASLVRDLIEGRDIVIEPQRSPTILIKDAKPKDVPTRAARITAVVRAASVDADVIALIAHEDCDALEPAHEGVVSKIQNALAGIAPVLVVAAPAWEFEAWLMQWPDAFALYRPSWSSVNKYAGRRVGLIADAKEDLTRCLRTQGTSVRDYRESDAPALAEIVGDNGWSRAPRARSDSYSSFVAQVDALLA